MASSRTAPRPGACIHAATMELNPRDPPATLTFALVLVAILVLGVLAEGAPPPEPTTGGAAPTAASAPTAVPPGGAVGPGPAR